MTEADTTPKTLDRQAPGFRRNPPHLSASETALAHLAAWTIATEQLPPGATLLEPVDSSTTWWAIRHPRTDAVFGWHADARRLLRLYWQALSEARQRNHRSRHAKRTEASLRAIRLSDGERRSADHVHRWSGGGGHRIA